MAPDGLTPAALGFFPHSGWAAVVCLGGTVPSPVVIERRRLLLTSASLPREPYHLAKRSEGREAREIVAAAVAEARKLAADAIADLVASVAARVYEVVAGGVITGRGRPDFTFQQALSTHATMHNAEGWLFREALVQAGQGIGLSMTATPPDAVYAEAASAVGIAVTEIEARIKELGDGLGPPWGKDEAVIGGRVAGARPGPAALVSGRVTRRQLLAGLRSDCHKRGTPMVVSILTRKTRIAERSRWDSALQSVLPRIRKVVEQQPGFVSVQYLWGVYEEGAIAQITTWKSEEDCRRYVREGAAATVATIEEAAIPTAPHPDGAWVRHTYEIASS